LAVFLVKVWADKDNARKFTASLLEYITFHGVHVESSHVNLKSISLTLGYDILFNNTVKVLGISLSGDKDVGWNVDKVFKMFLYSSLTPLTPVAYYLVYEATGYFVEREEVRTYVVKQLHEIFKKNTVRQKPVECIPEFKVHSDILDAASYSMYALLTGIHRYSIAIRQVASQWLTYELYKRGRNDFLQYLLSLIALDTYVWLPVASYSKFGVHLTEYHYALAAEPLREIDVKKAENILKDKEKAISLAEELKNRLGNICDKGCDPLTFIDDVVRDVMRKIIGEVVAKETGAETLVRYLRMALSNIGKNRKYETIIVPLTEQIGPGFIGFLRELIDFRKIIIPYTQLTLQNRIVLEKYLDKYLSNVEKEFIPVPASSPEVAKNIVKAIIENVVKETDASKCLCIIQGPLTITLPLCLECRRLKVETVPHSI